MKAGLHPTPINIRATDVARILWWRGNSAALVLKDGRECTVLTNSRDETLWMNRLVARIEKLQKEQL